MTGDQNVRRRAFLFAAAGASEVVGAPLVAGQSDNTTDNETGLPNIGQNGSNQASPTPRPEPTGTPNPTSEPTEPFEPTETEANDDDDGWFFDSSTTSPTDGDIRFVQMRYDPLGNDALHTEEEWVKFQNVSGGFINLEGCRIENSYGSIYEFDRLQLDRERTVRLHTGHGMDGDEVVFWGRNQQVWNNHGDTVHFYNPDGELLVEVSYSGDCESGYHPCRDASSGGTPTPSGTRTPVPVTQTTTASSGGSDSTPAVWDASTPTPRERTASTGGTGSGAETATRTPFTIGSEDPTPSPSEEVVTWESTSTSESTPAVTPTGTGTDGGGVDEVADETDTEGATADAPEFGALATLGGLAAATAHLLTRADEFDDKE